LNIYLLQFCKALLEYGIPSVSASSGSQKAVARIGAVHMPPPGHGL